MREALLIPIYHVNIKRMHKGATKKKPHSICTTGRKWSVWTTCVVVGVVPSWGGILKLVISLMTVITQRRL